MILIAINNHNVSSKVTFFLYVKPSSKTFSFNLKQRIYTNTYNPPSIIPPSTN